MHIKNPFIKEYDFDTLIQHETALKEFVFINQYGNKTIKFSDKQAVKALNTALLKSQYGIVWTIPENNLCPPIPGRLDYLLHIADLIAKKEIRLLDIGTGANLIYPILATCHFNWQCTASEVDTHSLEHAQSIINENSALRSIEIRQQKYTTKIFEQLIQTDDFFDVVVCNPPFYKNAFDAQKHNKRKVKNLQLEEKETLNFGGQSNELWYKGGELAFLRKMVAESSQFKKQVHWFTALISKQDNVKSVKRAINKTEPTAVKVVNMEQGNKISRFIAWTFV